MLFFVSPSEYKKDVTSTTAFTLQLNDGRILHRQHRSALVVSSTSWTGNCKQKKEKQNQRKKNMKKASSFISTVVSKTDLLKNCLLFSLFKMALKVAYTVHYVLQFSSFCLHVVLQCAIECTLCTQLLIQCCIAECACMSSYI